jgi:cellulose synthase/poly-beta-1,6-N-acetylglucosamine synthase-like glycosyltransferase
MFFTRFKTVALCLLLTVLSKASPPLPKRMTARFAISAAKRKPWGQQYNYNFLLKSWAKLRDKQVLELANLVKSLLDGPKFSVVVPVYNPQPKLLAETIDSIYAQSYTNWEIFLADNGSTNPLVHEILRDYAARDPRIKVVFSEDIGHSYPAYKSAIEAALGQFIAVVACDDLIDRDALLLVAKEIHDHPSAMVIYTDEDIVSAKGKRSDPYFKPDWNRLLILER